LSHTPLPPPPPLQQSAQPPPPGTNESGRETNISALLDESSSNDTVQVNSPPSLCMLLKAGQNC
jgi:WW domain-binding protein 11